MTTYDKIILNKDGHEFSVNAKIQISNEEVYDIIKDTYDISEIAEYFFSLANFRQTNLLEAVLKDYLDFILKEYNDDDSKNYEFFKNEALSDSDYKTESGKFSRIIAPSLYDNNDFNMIFTLYKSLKSVFEGKVE